MGQTIKDFTSCLGTAVIGTVLLLVLAGAVYSAGTRQPLPDSLPTLPALPALPEALPSLPQVTVVQPTAVDDYDYEAARSQEQQMAYALATAEAQSFMVAATADAISRQQAAQDTAVMQAESLLLMDGDMLLTEGIRVFGAAREPNAEGSYQLTNGLWVSVEFAEYLANCGYAQAKGLRANPGCPPNSAGLLPAGR